MHKYILGLSVLVVMGFVGYLATNVQLNNGSAEDNLAASAKSSSCSKAKKEYTKAQHDYNKCADNNGGSGCSGKKNKITQVIKKVNKACGTSWYNAN